MKIKGLFDKWVNLPSNKVFNRETVVKSGSKNVKVVVVLLLDFSPKSLAVLRM